MEIFDEQQRVNATEPTQVIPDDMYHPSYDGSAHWVRFAADGSIDRESTAETIARQRAAEAERVQPPRMQTIIDPV